MALLRATTLTTTLGVRLGQPWAMIDFRNVVYCPAASFLHGGNPYDQQQLTAVCPRSAGFPPFAPATLLLHAPFGVLPASWAGRVYTAWTLLLTLVLAGLALHINRIRPSGTAVIFIAGCVLLSRPGQWNLLLGNLAVELTLATYVALHYAGRSNWLSAIGLAVAAVKPSFGVPLGLLMLVRGDVRAVGLAVVLAVAMNLPPLLILADRAGGWAELGRVATSAQASWSEIVAMTAVTSAYRVDLPAFVARVSGQVLAEPAGVLIGLAVIGAAAVGVRSLRRRNGEEPARRLSSDLICMAMLLSLYHLGYDLVLLTATGVTLAIGSVPEWTSRRFRPLMLTCVTLLAANYVTAETILVHLHERWLWLPVACLNCALLLILFAGYVIQALRASQLSAHRA